MPIRCSVADCDRLDALDEGGDPGGELDQLRAGTAAGRQWRRVHVLRSPLNDYLCYECEWCYTYNVAAGEDVRILDVAETPAGEALLSVGDFFVAHPQYHRATPAARGRR
ncbi:MAG: DUF6879 family protein [Pseudonocardiaceae bacterium]